MSKSTIWNSRNNQDENSQSSEEKTVKMLIALDDYLPINGTFFCIVNLQTKHFIYVSKNFYRSTQLSKEKMKISGFGYFTSRIHPSDIKFWKLSSEKLMACNTDNFNNPIANYHINQVTNYRLKNGLGEYINIIQSTTPIQFDKNQKPVIVYSSFTVLHPKLQIDVTTNIKYLDHNNQYKSLFYKNYATQKLISKISNREKEVLKLLVAKKTSREIGKKLHISFNTVNTHRRNILKKLKVSSTGELLSYISTKTKLDL